MERESPSGTRFPRRVRPISIVWSADDEAFVAEVPGLPGCMAHGDTYEGARANAMEAIGLWLDTAREFGDPIPEPKGRRLALA